MADLDRLITLTLRAEGVRVSGRYQIGPIIFDGPVWARYEDFGSSLDLVVDTSVSTTETRNFRVRYDPRLINLTALAEQVVVTDEDGITWTTQQVAEADSRRRFHRIQCVREVA